jgi:hypothetical protein
MTTYVNPELYNPEAAVDQLVADGDLVVFMDAYSSSFATVMANEIASFTPSITKTAFNGGFKADIAAMTNQTEPDNTGVVNHYAIVDTTNSKVLNVGESSGETITATEPFNTPAFSVKFPKIATSA